MMEKDGEQYLHEEVKQRIKATMTSSIQALFAYINRCVVLGDILPQHSRDKCLHFSSGFIIRPFFVVVVAIPTKTKTNLNTSSAQQKLACHYTIKSCSPFYLQTLM
jgi:hypothetical protein